MQKIFTTFAFAALSIASSLAQQADPRPPLREIPEPALPSGTAIAFGPDEDVVGRVVQLISAAQTELLVAHYAITDPRVARAIADAYTKSKVFTVVLVEADAGEDAHATAQWMGRRGVPVFIRSNSRGTYNQHMVIVDRQTLVLTTADLSLAAKTNSETLLVTAEPALVARCYNRIIRDLADAAPIQVEAAPKR